MNNRKVSPGFTFIELVVVISILSVMLLFAVPLFRGTFYLQREKTEVSGLSGLIAALKTKAVTAGKDFYLHIEPYSAEVWVSDETMSGDDLYEARRNAAVFDGETQILGVETRDFKTGGRAGLIGFYKQGYSDAALIHLRRDGRDITLKLRVFLPGVEQIQRYVSFEDCME